MTAGLVIQETISISTWQRGHTSGSTSKTLRSSRAQAERRAACEEPGAAGDEGSRRTDEHPRASYGAPALALPEVATPGDDGFLTLFDLLEHWRGRLRGCGALGVSHAAGHPGPHPARPGRCPPGSCGAERC